MKPIEEIVTQYRTFYVADKKLGVTATQLRRLVKLGALVDADGNVWIKSKSKLKRGADSE